MKQDEKFEVKYKSDKFNIYEFLNNHPGGINYVKPYEDKDVTKPMDVYEHSKAAYYLLKEYRNKGRDPGAEDDLEKLVDWNKPMLSQVGSLGEHYKEWVISPVDRQLRLFGNPLLENLTITPWYLVPTIWVPVVTYLVITGSRTYINNTKDTSPFVPIVLSIIEGVILWTLVEYSLHRWVFHIEPSGKSKAMIYFHFAIHGLHHKVPFDSGRLVFPPFPAAVITFLLYKLVLSFLIPESTRVLVLSGGLAGYVVYDMIHFYLHHGAPKEDGYFYRLKRYHNQHHFAHHNNGFGISSMFWDKIFGTALKLKQLKLGIKW